MPIQNQQPSLVKLLSLNGTELTVGAISFGVETSVRNNDQYTTSDRLRRYYYTPTKKLKVNYDWLPSKPDFTVDGRAGRDFVVNLAETAPSVSVSYIDQQDTLNTFQAFLSEYHESILRRDGASQCIYYKVDFVLEGI